MIDEKLSPQEALYPHEIVGQAAGEVAVDATVNFLDDPDSDVITSGGTDLGEKATAALRAEFSAQRDAILALPTNEVGVDVSSIDNYRREVGAPKKEFRILDPGPYDKAIALSQTHTGEEEGKYLGKQDLIVLRRNPELEKLNGPELTASFGVHEIAHSWARSEIRASVDTTTVRTGFFKRQTVADVSPEIVQIGYARVMPDGSTRGLAVEEGYAEYERGQYVVNDLDRINGFSGMSPKPGRETSSAGNRLIKYAYLEMRDGEPQLATPQGSKAAVVYEMLIEQDQEIKTLLRAGRDSENAALQLQVHINAVMPGLYDKLDSIDLKNADEERELTQLMLEVEKFLKDRK